MKGQVQVTRTLLAKRHFLITLIIYIMCSGNCTLPPSAASQTRTHEHDDKNSEDFGHISKDSFCMSWSTVERREPYSYLELKMPAADILPHKPRAGIHTSTFLSVHGLTITTGFPDTFFKIQVSTLTF